MRDEAFGVLEDAFDQVQTAVRHAASKAGLEWSDEETLYRLSYRLTMAKVLDQPQLSAIDHFRRAHSLLMSMRQPPSPEAVSECVALASALVRSIPADAMAA